jgi:hypothetical protein
MLTLDEPHYVAHGLVNGEDLMPTSDYACATRRNNIVNDHVTSFLGVMEGFKGSPARWHKLGPT